MDVGVAIVGGGPVGLTAALELDRFGIAATVLERHPTTTTHPKARNLNTRTMEIARQWGPEVHEGLKALNLPRDWTGQIVYARSLAGEELGVMRTKGFGGAGADISPEIPLLSSQDMFEPVLADGARAAGAEIRFDTTVQRVRPLDGEVALDVTGPGGAYEIRAEHVIAADGSRSGVRRQLGVQLEGVRDLRHFVNVNFRADLSRWTAHRPAMLFWVLSETVRGVLQPLDGRERWLCQIPYDGTPEALAAHTPERCAEWIRSAVGAPGAEPEILSIERWSLSSVVAEKLVHDRVFLAGDAAHQIPPIGGFGLNTSVQSVHNLVWKLAMVRDGRAGPALLDTYDVERRAVAAYNGERSIENTMLVEAISRAASGADPDVSPAEAVANSTQYGNFVGMELGYGYDSAAVVPDGRPPRKVADPITEYAPDGRPGHRAPHVDLGGGRSTLDLCSGPDFVLLAGPEGGGWLEASPVPVHVIDAAPFCERYGLAPGGAVLVRPDGHVAYRCHEGIDAAGLMDALARVIAA